MKSHNLKYSNNSELEEFIKQNSIEQSENTLVQIFSGVIDKDILLNLAKKVKEFLPNSHILGTTTAGEICDAQMSENSIVISFSTFDKTVLSSNIYQMGNDCAKNIVNDLVKDDTKVLIIFSDGLKSNGEEILEQLSKLKPDLIIAGGRAADNVTFSQTYIFNENQILDNGCVIASLNSNTLNVHNNYILNWKTIGKDMVVTKANKNNLIEINHQKVTDIYKKYLGNDVVETLPESGIEFPLIFEKNGVSVARAPVAVLDDGSLIFAGNLEVGTKVKFGFGDIETIKESSYENYETLKNFPIESTFIYSCSARKALVGQELEVEFGLLQNIAPTAGFITYGEYYHSDMSNELLNITTTFLSLSESNDIKKPKEIKEKNKNLNKTLKALTHLVSATSDELNDTYSILNQAQHIASIGSWSWDIKNDEIWWSDEIYNMFGIDKSEFEATYDSFMQHVHPDDRDLLNIAIKNSLQNEEVPYLVKHKIVSGDGTVKTVKGQADILRDEGGIPIKMTGVVQDITLDVEQEMKLIELKNQAQQASKSKSEFLANMSHEIRTPLNAILGFVDLLKDESKGRKSLEYVDVIYSSSQSLLQIIGDILDFSKIESSKLDIDKIDFNAKAEFKLIIELFSAKCLEKGLKLSLLFDENIPNVINTDPLRIKQIITNLLSNAIKFTSSGKKIEVKISYKEPLLNISVVDEGKGIAKDKLLHIFDAFSQEDSSTTREFGGTGLGLSISSELVKLLGGELHVKSELGSGSEFYFSIPVEIGKDIEVKNSISHNTSFKDKKILLVEDNKSNQKFMSVLLKKLTLNFEIANDGLEALECFKNSKYDLILMDENMPNMNGIEATKKILNIEKGKNLQHTPIVALTANALKGDRERFMQVGMDEYLTKPIDKQKLDKVLNMFL